MSCSPAVLGSRFFRLGIFFIFYVPAHCAFEQREIGLADAVSEESEGGPLMTSRNASPFDSSLNDDAQERRLPSLEETEKCDANLYPFIKQLPYLKPQGLAKAMVAAMRERDNVKAAIIPLYGLDANSNYTDTGITEDPIGYSSSLLHWAAFYGALEQAEILLLRGADVRAVNSENCTALHVAAWVGSRSVAQVLLIAGADVDALDRYVWTPLYHASRQGNAGVVKVLLIAGANPAIASSVGWAPLHVAAWKGHLEIAQVLVEMGALKNVVTTAGETPLDRACKSTDAKCSDTTKAALEELLSA